MTHSNDQPGFIASHRVANPVKYRPGSPGGGRDGKMPQPD